MKLVVRSQHVRGATERPDPHRCCIVCAAPFTHLCCVSFRPCTAHRLQKQTERVIGETQNRAHWRRVMAEFGAKLCSYPGCRQHDFLPFTCSACGRVFCQEHRVIGSGHGCDPGEAYLASVRKRCVCLFSVCLCVCACARVRARHEPQTWEIKYVLGTGMHVRACVLEKYLRCPELCSRGVLVSCIRLSNCLQVNILLQVGQEKLCRLEILRSYVQR